MTAIRPVCLVTGANSGVGFETSRRMAEAGWRVVMACRSAARGEAARERLSETLGASRFELEIADLARLSDVEALADRVAARHRVLHGLVLNAGLYSGELRRTPGGFETTMGVNHVAHVLLTVRLIPALLEGRGRIVSVTSGGHERAKPKRAPLAAILDGGAWKGGLTAYCDSKLANILFAYELDRRLRAHGVRADAVHPGVLATRIWEHPTGVAGVLARLGRMFMADAHRGGEAVSRPLLDPALADGGGRYFDRTEESEPSADARDVRLADRMCEVSLEALGITFPSLPDLPGSPPGRSRSRWPGPD